MLAPAGSLLLALQQIPDPRGRQGRRHSLSAMLATVVSALLCGSRSYSAIMEVPGKTNEHKTALELLKTLVVKGRLITGDAIFCQRDLCRQIVDDDGHYFFMVKDNQPELKKAIEAEFKPAFSPLRRASAAIAPVGG